MTKPPGPIARTLNRGPATVVDGLKHSFDAIFAGQESDGPVEPGRVEAAPLSDEDRKLAASMAGRDEDFPLDPIFPYSGATRARRFHARNDRQALEEQVKLDTGSRK